MTYQQISRGQWLLRLTIVALVVGAWACSPDAGSGCEDARDEMKRQITDVCDESAYRDAAFCKTCVKAGYYSLTVAADSCFCADLIFDVDFCAYERGANGRPKVRSAVGYAVSVCSNPNLPAGGAGSGGAGGTAGGGPAGSAGGGAANSAGEANAGVGG